MSIFDAIKKSAMEGFSSSISVPDIIFSIGIAFVAGIFILLIYRLTYKGVSFSRSYEGTLLMICTVSALIVLTITSNLVLSLGMVGALSIVRFRTAIKEPLDIAFLFWAIAAGIVLAAGMIPLAVFGSVFIGLILVVFVNRKAHTDPYIVVVSCRDSESEKRVQEIIKANTQKYVIKSKTARAGALELNYEIRLKGENTNFINTLSGQDGVTSAVLVSYNGDYMG
jgi:hypothetical protein